MGLSARLDASASATGRSHAVSVTSSPPTRFTNTSCSCSETPACRFITASSMATRWASSPCATRRGEPKRMRSTSACSSTSSGRRPSRVTVDDAARRRRAGARQEDRRRIAHFAQSLLAHVEERQFAHRAEAVLGGAHVAEAAGRIAFEVQHRVDQVLEHARTGDGAVLGHVADDDDADARALGEAHQLRRAFLELRDRAGRRAHRGELHGLDGVDDQQLHALLAGARHHGFEVGVGDHAQVRTAHAEPPGAHADLRRGLLGRQVQRRGLTRAA